MFDIGWTELLVIAVVASVVIGPKDRPRAMRTVGQFVGKMKRMARDFQGQFNEALREAELDDVKKSVQEIARLDPMADLKTEIAKSDASLKDDQGQTATDVATRNGNIESAQAIMVLGAAKAAESEPSPAPEKGQGTSSQ